MALLTNATVVLVLACLSHQLVLGGCQKSHGRRGGGDMERFQQRAGRQPKSVSAQPFKGKLVTKDKSECNWAATGEDLVILNVSCKKGDRSFSCEYSARPAVCPQYASNTELYWKQISRSLKKQKSLCRDNGALIKAGVCRKAAREAHFRIHVAQRRTASPYTPPFAARAVKSCQPANKKLAEEFCSNSWSSLCTFLFTAVKDYDC
ncbi:fibroblast growth factor-binding protein 1 [Cololabis saira]|uniref:fibroblast growth factor-binding protein 1 n=1 Tax=Cololabis saira TaxID=129043 RepID=UPI002AD5494A|nr:fibroblast growth factor-binding protein 1 [Cololabis saira]